MFSRILESKILPLLGISACVGDAAFIEFIILMSAAPTQEGRSFQTLFIALSLRVAILYFFTRSVPSIDLSNTLPLFS